LFVFFTMDKPKFKLLKVASESDLLRTHPGLSFADVTLFWTEVGSVLHHYDGIDLSCYSWTTLSLALMQTLFPDLVIRTELKTEALDGIGDLIYSNLSSKLKVRLGDSIEYFVESLIYPHREGATLKTYREVLAWMEKFPGSISFATVQEFPSFPSTEALISRVSKDYAARLSVEGYLKKFGPVSIAEIQGRFLQNTSRYDETTGLLRDFKVLFLQQSRSLRLLYVYCWNAFRYLVA
jgi:hypothetical protein